jgi:hypothetical protein
VPWFLVDDHFHSHPHAAKALATEPAALSLWLLAGSWSSAHLTDGVVPDDELPRLAPDAVKLAEALVTARLWRRVKGGYKFVPGVTHKIPARAAVERDRESAAERQRRRREAVSSRRDTTVTNAVSHGVTLDRTDTTKEHPPNPPPSGGHDGSHPNCRACGTNRRRPPPEPAPTPVPPPFAQVHNVNGKPAHGAAVRAAAAQARTAIAKEKP